MPVDRRKRTHRRRAGAGFGGAVRRWFTAIGRTAADFRRDISGAVLAVTAAMMITTMGLAGLGIDVGSWYTTKRSMQSAADAAAINAGIEMTTLGGYTDAQVVAAGRQSAAQNGFDTSTGAQVDVSIADDDESVTVQITQPSPTFFASLILGGSVNIRAAATASLNGSPICLLSLEPTAPQGLLLYANVPLTASCAVQVNSTNSAAMEVRSNSILSSEENCVTGDYTVGSTVTLSPTPRTGCLAVPDPFADIAPPSYSGCDYTNVVVNDSAVTLNPGVYCGGLRIRNNSSVQFSPGDYIIKGKDFRVDSNSSVQGTGVGFYLTNGANIHFRSNSTADFTAPTTGPLAGMVIFQDRNDSGINRLHSNTLTRLEGAVYSANGTIDFNSNNAIGANSAFMIVVGRYIGLNSNVQVVVNSDYDATDVPLVAPMLRAQRVRLTK